MKTLTITAAIIAALAVPSMLPAADQSSTTVPLVCRPAGPSEVSNATSGSTALLCHKIDMEHIKAAITKPQEVEGRMDQATRDQVEALEKKMTKGETYS